MRSGYFAEVATIEASLDNSRFCQESWSATPTPPQKWPLRPGEPERPLLVRILVHLLSVKQPFCILVFGFDQALGSRFV